MKLYRKLGDKTLPTRRLHNGIQVSDASFVSPETQCFISRRQTQCQDYILNLKI